MEQNIRILLVPVAGTPRAITVPNELREIQKLVHGYIETIHLDEHSILICNEEGKIIGLPFNRALPTGRDAIFGNFIIVGDAGEDFGSLTDAQLQRYAASFALPPIVMVQYESKTQRGAYAGREYSYFAEVQLCVGDVVSVPTKFGHSRARVSKINVPVETVAAYIGALKHITAMPDERGTTAEPAPACRPTMPHETAEQLFFS